MLPFTFFPPGNPQSHVPTFTTLQMFNIGNTHSFFSLKMI